MRAKTPNQPHNRCTGCGRLAVFTGRVEACPLHGIHAVLVPWTKARDRAYQTILSMAAQLPHPLDFEAWAMALPNDTYPGITQAMGREALGYARRWDASVRDAEESFGRERKAITLFGRGPRL